MARNRNLSISRPVSLFVKYSVVFAIFGLLANTACPATFAAAVTATGSRSKRQLPPLEQGNQVIDDIFQIPISTLNAVGSLIKSTRPLVRRTRERIQQYYNGAQQQPLQFQQQQQQSLYSYSNSKPRPVQQYSPTTSQNSYFYGNSNRWKQRREDPLPQGRKHSHVSDDY
ncbi:Hypothetical protein CINCED_3A004179 [Cinara cedri]|uniref:Uncharacterized protein n=1 Tax=Cinara cedri TaxID=506608 RepID=A0A5E4NMV9_9HEMI|nr:Hypothetical protein CINCED_3A004179 [Cinara cedri]